MVDIQHGIRIYHWKHGWIPLDHFAALKKAHGSERGARSALKKAHAAGHAHRSFVETGTHRAGTGAGSHLRAADGFRPVANEHLRREKHVIAAFHEGSRNFHLLDTQRGHTAVISEEQAREIHMNGHKIIGISKSESGGTQIKVQDMANGRVHRIDAVGDHLKGKGSLRPEPTAKPRTVAPAKTHETVLASGTPREERAARFKAAAAERAKAFREKHPATPAAKPATPNVKVGDHVMYGEHGGVVYKVHRVLPSGGVQAVAVAGMVNRRQVRHIPADKIRHATPPKPATPKPATPKPATLPVGQRVVVHGKHHGVVVQPPADMPNAVRVKMDDRERFWANGYAIFDARHVEPEAPRTPSGPKALASNDVAGHEKAVREAYDKLGRANMLGNMNDQHQARAAVDAAQKRLDAAKLRVQLSDNAKAMAKVDAERQVIRDAQAASEAGDHQKAAELFRKAGMPMHAKRAELNAKAAKPASWEKALMEGAKTPKPLDPRAQRKLALALQEKGRRLRRVDRLQEHRVNVQNADIAENHRQVLLRQVDAKLARAGVADRVKQERAVADAAAAEAMKGGAIDQHFQGGGSIMNAPQRGLFDYVKANPDRFTVKSSRKNGQVSDTFKITDKKTGEIAWRKDDGQARYGAIKEKLAADIGNKLGFFDHRANMDVSREGRANHVIIENAPNVQGFGERNRHNESGVGEAIHKGSDPASLMRMMMFDYLVANDEDRHYMNFHVVDEGGGKMRAAILDHGRAFGGASSNFENAPAHANFSEWFQKYKRYSARGWDANAVARAAYPQDHDASAAYDQIVAGMKKANVEDVIKQAMAAPGVESLPAAKQAEWAQLIRVRHAHLTDQKNKAGIIRAIKGI